MLLFTDEENIVIRLDSDCGVIFYTDVSIKDKRINPEQKIDSVSCETCKCVSRNNEYSCSIDKEHTSGIFLDPYNLLNMDPAALLSLNHTPHMDLLSIQ